MRLHHRMCLHRVLLHVTPSPCNIWLQRLQHVTATATLGACHCMPSRSNSNVRRDIHTCQVLQYVAVGCSTTPIRLNVFTNAKCCSVVQCGAVWCSVLQCIAVCRSADTTCNALQSQVPSCIMINTTYSKVNMHPPQHATPTPSPSPPATQSYTE